MSVTLRAVIRSRVSVPENRCQVAGGPNFSASTLYEAVALGLKVLKKHLFTGELTEGAVQVQIEGPAVEHTVRLRDFYQWVRRAEGHHSSEAGARDFEVDAVPVK